MEALVMTAACFPFVSTLSLIPCAGTARRAVEAAASPRVLGETEAMSVSGRILVERIVIELEIPGDSRSLFRLRLDNKVVGENLTAVQTHLLVGEILDRITLTRPAERE